MKLEGYRIIPHEISKAPLKDVINKWRQSVEKSQSDESVDPLSDTFVYILKSVDSVAAKFPLHNGSKSLLAYLTANKDTKDYYSPDSGLRLFYSMAAQPDAKDNTSGVYQMINISNIVANTYDEKKLPIYVMQSDFFKKLVQTDISEVPLELYPKNFKGYISFERGLLKELDSDPYDIIGAYVNVVNGELTILLVAESPLGDIVPHVINVDNWAERTQDYYRRDTYKEYYSIINAISLSVVYISCGNPDLRVLKSLSKLPPSAIRGLRNKGVNIEEEYDDEIPSDVTLVSWSWKKDPRYTQGKWGVRAFFRVQRYGPGRSQTRVIWIAPHLAHRRKDLLTSDDDSSDPEAGNPVDFEFIFGDLY